MKILQSRLEKDFETFVKSLTKLEPAEFCGVAKMLKVEVADIEGAKQKIEEVKQTRGKRTEITVVDECCDSDLREALKDIEFPLRPMEDVMNELMDSFLGLSKHARRELLKIMKDCPRGR